MGVPFNAINEKLNLGFDDIEGGDVGYLPFSLTPVSILSEPPEPKEEPKDEPAKIAAPKKSVSSFTLQKISSAHMKQHAGIERSVQSAVSAYFYGQRKRVLERIDPKKYASGAVAKDVITKDTVDFAFDFTEEEKIFVKRIMPSLTAAAWAGVEFAEGVNSGNVDRAVLDGRLRSYLAIRADKIKTIPHTSLKKVRSIVEESLKQGETVNQLADKVRDFYRVSAPVYSLRVARTETNIALNGGAFQYYKTIGAQKKTWVTAGDEHVRDSHAALNGKSVNIDERFENGLMFPGDDGDAAEVVNCRCTYIVENLEN
jgi:SPP1 gp7 family putative phage head morphogenesis protein